MLAQNLLNSFPRDHERAPDAQRYLGVQTLTYAQVAGKGAKQIPFDQVPIERATQFAAQEAAVTLALHQALWPQLAAVPTLARLYEQIEQPLMPVLAKMEHYGVLVDRERLRTQSREFAQQLQELLVQAHREAGLEFNI